MTAGRPFVVVERRLSGRWWLIMRGSRVVGRVRAPGRRQALADVQAELGGTAYSTGGFYDVLHGTKLGAPLRIVKTLDEHDLAVRR